jgi:hypothetical protein
MRNDTFMRTYSPRQEAMARAAAQERQAAATRPASAASDSADLTQYMVQEEPYYHPVSDEVDMYEAADWLRQDAFRGIHGVEARQAADYRGL